MSANKSQDASPDTLGIIIRYPFYISDRKWTFSTFDPNLKLNIMYCQFHPLLDNMEQRSKISYLNDNL